MSTAAADMAPDTGIHGENDPIQQQLPNMPLIARPRARSLDGIEVSSGRTEAWLRVHLVSPTITRVIVQAQNTEGVVGVVVMVVVVVVAVAKGITLTQVDTKIESLERK